MRDSNSHIHRFPWIRNNPTSLGCIQASHSQTHTKSATEAFILTKIVRKSVQRSHRLGTLGHRSEVCVCDSLWRCRIPVSEVINSLRVHICIGLLGRGRIEHILEFVSKFITITFRCPRFSILVTDPLSIRICTIAALAPTRSDTLTRKTLIN